MGERCNFCGLPLHGAGLLCSGLSTCSERRAFEAGQEAGYLACLDYEARARAIRTVVAAQWGVAIALHGWSADACRSRGCHYSGCRCIDDAWPAADVAALPTAEQIVDGAA